jgi:hypothetical protein
VPAVRVATTSVFRAAYSENRDGNFPRDVCVIRRITRHVTVYRGSLLVSDLSLFRFNEQELRSNGDDTYSFVGHFFLTTPCITFEVNCNYVYNYYSNKMHTFFVIKITRYYNL